MITEQEVRDLTDNENALRAALNNREPLDHIRSILRQGDIDVTIVMSDGGNFLHLAVEKGYGEILRDLTKLGADVNAVAEDECPPIVIAVENNDKETVSALKELGADVNIPGPSGWTAVMIAAQNGYDEILTDLHGYEADVNAAESDGRTALIFAAENGHNETVKLLLDQGAHMNASSETGMTGLMTAAFNNHTEIVTTLLSRTMINVNAFNLDGETALSLTQDEEIKNSILTFLKTEEALIENELTTLSLEQEDNVDFVNLANKFFREDFETEGFICPITSSIISSPYYITTQTASGDEIIEPHRYQRGINPDNLSGISPMTRQMLVAITEDEAFKEEIQNYFSEKVPVLINGLIERGLYHLAKKIALNVENGVIIVDEKVKEELHSNYVPTIQHHLENTKAHNSEIQSTNSDTPPPSNINAKVGSSLSPSTSQNHNGGGSSHP